MWHHLGLALKRLGEMATSSHAFSRAIALSDGGTIYSVWQLADSTISNRPSDTLTLMKRIDITKTKDARFRLYLVIAQAFLAGLHRKDKWLAFGPCLADGLTVRASAERCKFAVNTAFRWRHRFLAPETGEAHELTGIVEADEPYVLESRKGERHLKRKARRRGGKAGLLARAKR